MKYDNQPTKRCPRERTNHNWCRWCGSLCDKDDRCEGCAENDSRLAVQALRQMTGEE